MTIKTLLDNEEVELIAPVPYHLLTNTIIVTVATRYLLNCYSSTAIHDPCMHVYTHACMYVCTYVCAVNRERFAELNFRGFHPMKFITGKTFTVPYVYNT